MAATLADLDNCRSDEPLAATTVSAVRRVQTTLAETWMPLIDQLVQCVALTGVQPVRFDLGDLRQSLPYVMAERFAWTVRTDPLDSAAMTVTEATALAARLNTGHLARLTDTDAELQWLAVKLANIAADPMLANAFTATFDRWAELCDMLTQRRLTVRFDVRFSAADATARSETVDGVFRQLGAVWQQCAASEAVLPELDAMQPYSASALARFVTMTSDQRAELTDHLLRRWYRGTDADHPPQWVDVGFAGPNTADLLFEVLVDDPAACVRYLQLAVDDPQTFLITASDTSLSHRVVHLGTSPRHVTAAEAGAVLVPLLHFFADDNRFLVNPGFETYDDTWTPFLADLCAPWLLQFSPLNNDWGATIEHAAERRELLAFVLRDDGALERITAAGNAALEGLAISLQRAGRVGDMLEETAAFIGMLGQLNVNERVADEQERAATWDLWWDLASLPLNLLPIAPGLIGGAALDELHAQAGAHGWLGAPSPAGVRDQAAYQAEWMLTVAGATMAAVGFDKLVARGDIDRDTPPPPLADPSSPSPQLQYERDYIEWQHAVFTSTDDALANEVDAWKSPFLNAASAGVAFAS